MDSFEYIVAEMFYRRGYWVRTSVRVDLTEEDKKKIDRHSSPRWELDVVAYNAGANFIEIIECKSYFDNNGVGHSWIDGVGQQADRFKLFTDKNLREVVIFRLVEQFTASGMCVENPSIKLSLACGKIRPKSREKLAEYLRLNNWSLYDEVWLKNELKSISKDGYENNILTVSSKIAFR